MDIYRPAMMERGAYLNSTMEAQRKLVPEMIELLQHRYRMLKYVKIAGPIGRRPLGEMVGLSERETRTMMDFLRTQHLINVARNGASITAEGETVLQSLEIAMDDWSGRAAIANKLAQLLGIRTVRLVSGDSFTNPATQNLLGMEAAKQFTLCIGNGKTVAVTGGSTLA